MSSPRIYHPGPLRSGQRIRLSEQAGRHVSQVLRLKSGTAVVLFDGSGGEYPATLEQVTRRDVIVETGEHVAVERESPLSITLIQGLSRGERMDITLQKATELGVMQIVPMETERCGVHLAAERKQKRQQHWQGVVIAACEQSGRNRVPEIQALTALQDYLAQTRDDGIASVVLAPDAPQSLAAFSSTHGTQPLRILAGPEGGLSPDEIRLAMDFGFEAVHLGPRILRTETAGLAALAILQGLAGDMK